MNIQLWLSLSVAFAGLWSGLLLTITTILHPMFAEQDIDGFRSDLGRFLPIARRSPTNYVLVIGLLVAPALAVAALASDAGSVPFVLTVIGLILTWTGAFGLSRFLAEPNYDTILDWTEADGLSEIRAARHRYFLLNWARGALVWMAFACFMVALYLEWV